MIKVRLQVPGIHQAKGHSCWRASTRMVLKYWGVDPPVLFPDKFKNDDTIDPSEFPDLARRAGFRRATDLTAPLTGEDLALELQRSGPIFAPGKYYNTLHIVVITGVQIDNLGTEVSYNDPYLPNGEEASMPLDFVNEMSHVQYFYVMDLSKVAKIYDVTLKEGSL